MTGLPVYLDLTPRLWLARIIPCLEADVTSTVDCVPFVRAFNFGAVLIEGLALA
jgi:hypothetical protein